MPSFNGEQIFIVTGASSGLGEATALMLNEKGATVIAIAGNEKRLLDMKARCKNPENMHIEIKDLAEDIEGLPQYVKSLKEKYGKFSGMAYCAGIVFLTPLRLLTYRDLKTVCDVNYFAPILMTKGLADRRNNIGKGASLVYISSIDAKISSKGQPSYSGSKAALSASIKAISKEVSDSGMRANCVLPSMIKTPMTVIVDDVTITEEFHKDDYPFGWGVPDDVAYVIVYLLSDKAKHISCQNYVI